MKNIKITLLSLILIIGNINLTHAMSFWSSISSNKNVKKYVLSAGAIATAGLVTWKLWKYYTTKANDIVELNKNFQDEQKYNAEADGDCNDANLATAVDNSIKSNIYEENIKVLAKFATYIKDKNAENDQILQTIAAQEAQKREKTANIIAQVKQKIALKRQQLLEELEDKELFEGDDIVLQTLEEQIIPVISNPNHSNYQKLVDNYQDWKEKLKKLDQSFDQKIEQEDISFNRLKGLQEKLNSAYKVGPWNDGKVILRKIFNNESIQGDYLKNVVQLFWHFYALCSTKGQSFERGTIRLEDKDNKIFNYISKCPGIYDRSGKIKSSHFHEMPDMPKYGLDIPHELRRNLCFQDDKFHILFGQLQSGTMFIKPEDRGINSISDVMEHAYHLIGSMHRRFIAQGANDQSGIQCEHVPHNISSIWDQLLSEFGLDKDQVYINAKKHGLYKMLELINVDRFKQNLNGKQQQIINRFTQALEEYDNLHLRKGREVILSHEKLLASLAL